MLLDAGTTLKGWRRTGKTFKALRQRRRRAPPPVCRIYIPPGKGDGHYFGRDAIECDGTMAKHPTFILEEPAFFYLYPTGPATAPPGPCPSIACIPIAADANHRYTTERAVRDADGRARAGSPRATARYRRDVRAGVTGDTSGVGTCASAAPTRSTAVRPATTALLATAADSDETGGEDRERCRDGPELAHMRATARATSTTSIQCTR